MGKNLQCHKLNNEWQEIGLVSTKKNHPSSLAMKGSREMGSSLKRLKRV